MYMRGRFQTLQQPILQRPQRSECKVIRLEAIGAYGAFAVTDPGRHSVFTPSNRGVEPNSFKVAVRLTEGPALCWQGHLTEVKT